MKITIQYRDVITRFENIKKVYYGYPSNNQSRAIITFNNKEHIEYRSPYTKIIEVEDE